MKKHFWFFELDISWPNVSLTAWKEEWNVIRIVQICSLGLGKFPQPPSLSPSTGCAGRGWRDDAGYLGTAWHSYIPALFTLKNIKHNFWLMGFLQEVQRCILGVFKRYSWTKKVWEHLGGVLGIPGSAAVGGDNIQGGRETALFCSIHDFWVLSSLVALAAQTLLTSLGLQERTVHYCYTKALLLQLTGSTVVTKGAFLLTNSSKKRSQIAWLLWWEANQLPG